MITKKWQQLIAKYSFIDDVKQKGAYVHLFYHCNGEQLLSKISIRANVKQVTKLLEKIRVKVGVSIHGKGLQTDYYII